MCVCVNSPKEISRFCVFHSFVNYVRFNPTLLFLLFPRSTKKEAAAAREINANTDFDYTPYSLIYIFCTLCRHISFLVFYGVCIAHSTARAHTEQPNRIELMYKHTETFSHTHAYNSSVRCALFNHHSSFGGGALATQPYGSIIRLAGKIWIFAKRLLLCYSAGTDENQR